MNIYQLSTRSGIPVSKLRKLDKLGALKASDAPEFLDTLIFHMRGNRTLSVAHLLTLRDQPPLLDDLRAEKPRYASRAREQLSALGDVSAHMAPRDVTAAIKGASRGDDDASLIIVDWLKAVLPAAPVPHAWVAARLLAPLNEFVRGEAAPLLSPALLNVRKLPEFAGWWHSKKIGTRSTIEYFRPALNDL